MADITLISGSTTGSAEYVAEHLAEKLEEAGYSTEIQHGPLIEDLQAEGIWLVISSTHGAGDIPDNLLPFYEALQESRQTCPPFVLAPWASATANTTPSAAPSTKSTAH